MNNADFKYHLEKYKGPRTKCICPNCGKRTFKLYVDSDENILDENVGRCDREVNCGYHYPPKDFFKDHPDYKRGSNWKPSVHVVRQEVKPVSFLPSEVLDEATDAEYYERNNLVRYLRRLFDGEAVLRSCEKYRVGTSKHWKGEDGGLATAFPQIDEHERIRQIKVMMYNPNTGRRLHDADKAWKQDGKSGSYLLDYNSKVWFAGNGILRTHDARFQQTFFGTHLIPQYPENTICIVESEKTAIIADLYYTPRFDDWMEDASGKVIWLATGGTNGGGWSSPEVCYVLKNRKVRLYPDLKCFEDWSKKAETLRKLGIDVAVSDYLEKNCTEVQREKGLDIADFIVEIIEKQKIKSII